jgi:hypothetical protein
LKDRIEFRATLRRPIEEESAEWLFLRVPQEASASLPSRGLVSVEGKLNGNEFLTTLQPDGEGGHWLKVTEQTAKKLKLSAGDEAHLVLSPTSEEPEPEVPQDFLDALDADPRAGSLWPQLTPMARRDWVHWITSGKKAETRVKRIAVACSKLAAGSRRPCCFDRSGMYSKSLSCPRSE